MKKTLLTLIAFAFVLISCEGEQETSNCVSFKNENIESVFLIESLVETTGYMFAVNFHCSNGCGDFDSFQESINGDTRTIKVLAKYDGCICTEDFPERNGIYTFTPSQSGTYTLKFDKGDGTFLTKIIVIE